MVGGMCNIQAYGIGAFCYIIYIVSVHSFFTYTSLDELDGRVESTSVSKPYVLFNGGSFGGTISSKICV